MRRKLATSVVAILIGIVLFGCATTKPTELTQAQQNDLNFYKILAGAKASYDTAFTVLADLQKQGKLSTTDAQKAIDAGNIFYLAYLIAESTYESYHAQVVANPNGTPTNQPTLQQQLQDISTKLGGFLAAVPQTGGAK